MEAALIRTRQRGGGLVQHLLLSKPGAVKALIRRLSAALMCAPTLDIKHSKPTGQSAVHARLGGYWLFFKSMTCPL